MRARDVRRFAHVVAGVALALATSSLAADEAKAPSEKAAPSVPADVEATPPASSSRESAVVAVIADDDLPIHRRVVSGIVVESRADVVELDLGGDASLGETVMKRALAESPRAIVAVGPRSLVAAMAATKDIPIVYCLVPRLEAYDLKAANVGGVRLETAPAAPLEVLKATMPGTRKVAVVFNPDESADALAELSRSGRALGIEIVGVEARLPEHVREALSKTKADALVMIADPTALHLTSFSAMLDHAALERIPLFALNARFVERGALLAFSTDYVGLGRQVGRLVNGLVEGDVAVDAIREVDPDGLELTANLSTAEAIGAPPSFASSLLEVGAARGVAVRVYR